MESTTFKTHRLLWILVAAAFGATLVAWQQKQNKPSGINHTQLAANDTIPKKKATKEKNIRNLDEALEDLDHVEINIDGDKINAELAKIGPEVENEISKAGIEINKAIRDIDIPSIKADINASLADIDWPEIKIEIDGTPVKIDWDKIKIETDQFKDIKLDKLHLDLDQMNSALQKIGPELQKNLAKVEINIEGAKSEIRAYKRFVDGLQADGLIDKKADYSIEHRNGELLIDGKVQSAEVYHKYEWFLEKHHTLQIKKSKDDFSIGDE